MTRRLCLGESQSITALFSGQLPLPFSSSYSSFPEFSASALDRVSTLPPLPVPHQHQILHLSTSLCGPVEQHAHLFDPQRCYCSHCGGASHCYFHLLPHKPYAPRPYPDPIHKFSDADPAGGINIEGLAGTLLVILGILGSIIIAPFTISTRTRMDKETDTLRQVHHPSTSPVQSRYRLGEMVSSPLPTPCPRAVPISLHFTHLSGLQPQAAGDHALYCLGCGVG